MIYTSILIILGLSVFEAISSIDNAIINAEVLQTMKPKSRKWFLLWGIIIGVFLVRGLLPFLIVYLANPGLGLIKTFTATFSGDPAVIRSIEESSHLLLSGGGIFLIFLFFHWLFLEQKNFGLIGERFFYSQGVWFYAIISIILSLVVWLSLSVDPVMALTLIIGSTVFFITHGFKENAKQNEKKLMGKNLTDISKIFYLEIIDATFSIDGVLGAFAFTMSIPLILLGNGLGAIIVRQLTIGNIERIKKYKYLKNGAMYSILVLGIIMLFDAFGIKVEQWVSPVVTFIIIGYFYYRSKISLGDLAQAFESK